MPCTDFGACLSSHTMALLCCSNKLLQAVENNDLWNGPIAKIGRLNLLWSLAKSGSSTSLNVSKIKQQDAFFVAFIILVMYSHRYSMLSRSLTNGMSFIFSCGSSGIGLPILQSDQIDRSSKAIWQYKLKESETVKDRSTYLYIRES